MYDRETERKPVETDIPSAQYGTEPFVKIYTPRHLRHPLQPGSAVSFDEGEQLRIWHGSALAAGKKD